MRKPAFVVALFLALAAGSFPATAHADPPHHPWGFLCGFAARTDPEVEGSQTGELGGGPVFLGRGVSGRVVCTIQANAASHGWRGAEVSAEGSEVVLAEGAVTFATDRDDNVYVCTRVEYADGSTLYYDDPNDPLADGSWSTWPGVSCGLATTTPASTPEDYTTSWLIHELNVVICPFLAILYRPDGDIPGVWECPPYVSWPGGALQGYSVVRARQFVWPPPGAFDPGQPPVVPVACSDGADNDGDGWTDYPSDPDCTDSRDTTESPQPPCPDAAGVTYCASLTPTTEHLRYDVAGTSSASARVAGYVDAYEFTLPNGAVTTLPCVVLLAAGTTGDACALAGGRFLSRTLTLTDTAVAQPGEVTGSPVLTVRVCNADLALTVGPYGVTKWPAYTVC